MSAVAAVGPRVAEQALTLSVVVAVAAVGFELGSLSRAEQPSDFAGAGKNLKDFFHSKHIGSLSVVPVGVPLVAVAVVVELAVSNSAIWSD